MVGLFIAINLQRAVSRVAMLLSAGLFGWAQLASATSEEGVSCQRLIALSPSLVEVAATLNLTDELVGVSRFTEYPEKARQLAQVGGFLDPNLEAMVVLKPTLILGLSEHRELLDKLKRLGAASLQSDHRSIAGILESITAVGKACSRESIALQRVGELRALVGEYKQKLIGKKRLRALVLIGGKQDAINFTNLYVSGRDGYYADLLGLAGGLNVFSGITRPFSGVSREAFIKEDPEVIFHIVTDGNISAADKRAILAGWRGLNYLRAVKGNHVFLLTDYVDVIPGPRFPETLAKIAQAIAESR